MSFGTDGNKAGATLLQHVCSMLMSLLHNSFEHSDSDGVAYFMYSGLQTEQPLVCTLNSDNEILSECGLFLVIA